ncbi:MAG TPA: DUF1684 domain-containing protein [Vicinamibacterales bacterium]|nr:DUF1684 domain-containing protein [Vicinamibacterales bacterium]
MRPLRAALAALILLTAACARELTYEQEVGAWRAEKDQFMRSADSPVPGPERAGFPPLTYFPVSEEYRAPASLTVAPGTDVMEMSTSTGQRRKMRRIGTLAFTLKGEPLALTAFADASDTELRRLFVPFGDLTNGAETYPGGRYLDLDRTATGIYDLDFNRAYHPFCLFNPQYDCPLPPRENRLQVPVRAGERLGPPPA